jgi:hypothetical protein
VTINEDEAFGLVEPHLQTLWECVTNAWNRYQTNPESLIYQRRTRATVVNDLIFSEIIAGFDEVPDTRIAQDRKRNLRFLVLGERCCLWIKKVNVGRQSANYLTAHARLLLSGRQLSLFPRMSVITVGYMLNRDETAIQRLSFNPPFLFRRPRWFFDILPAEEQPRSMAASGSGLQIVSGAGRTRLIVRRGERQWPLL